MGTRSHNQSKSTPEPTTAAPQTTLQPRPFAQPTQAESTPTLEDVHAQLEHAQQSGHHLTNFAASQPEPPPLSIQPKLTIGAPGDKYEQEADRVAQQVVQRIHMPKPAVYKPDLSQHPSSAQRALSPMQHDLQLKPLLQREEILEEDELQMKPILQRKTEAGAVDASTEIEHEIQQSRGSGQPLANSIRQPMEQAFGNVDFSGVTVHTDSQSDQLNRSIQAKAFTTGQDIFFRQGSYQPGSRGGQELLAHELTHVVQQNGGAVQRSPLFQEQRSEYPATETNLPTDDFKTSIKSLPSLSSKAGVVQRKLGRGVKPGTKVIKHEYSGDVVDTYIIEKVSGYKCEIKNTKTNEIIPNISINDHSWCKVEDQVQSRKEWEKAKDEEGLLAGENYLSADYRRINPLLGALEAEGYSATQVGDPSLDITDKQEKILKRWKEIAVARKNATKEDVEGWDVKHLQNTLDLFKSIHHVWSKFDKKPIPNNVVCRGDTVALYKSYPFLDPTENDYPDGENSVSKTIDWPGIMSTTVGDPKTHNFIQAKSIVWKIDVPENHAGKILGANNQSEAEATFPVGTKVQVNKIIVRRVNKKLKADEFGEVAEVIVLAQIVSTETVSEQSLKDLSPEKLSIPTPPSPLKFESTPEVTPKKKELSTSEKMQLAILKRGLKQMTPNSEEAIEQQRKITALEGTPEVTPKKKGILSQEERLKRLELQESIVKEMMKDVAEVPTSESPHAILMMGGPGAGKSSALPEVVPDQKNYVKTDPDKIKEQLPEYKAGLDKGDTGIADQLHNESKLIADDLASKAIAGRRHLIYDSTGVNETGYSSLIEKLKKANYKVTLVMVHLEREEGLRRMRARAEKEGRYVDESFAKSAYPIISKNFLKLAPQVHEAFLYDNTVEQGKKPKLVWKQDQDIKLAEQVLSVNESSTVIESPKPKLKSEPHDSGPVLTVGEDLVGKEDNATYHVEMIIPGGAHGAWKIKRLTDGAFFLWKPAASASGKKDGSDLMADAEVGATGLSNFIVGGYLVPRAERLTLNSHLGTCQPFINVKKGATFNPENLKGKQAAQLVAHMIADWIISNHDNNDTQFLFDTDDNLIGIDKGQAFKHFKEGGVESRFVTKAKKEISKLPEKNEANAFTHEKWESDIEPEHLDPGYHPSGNFKVPSPKPFVDKAMKLDKLPFSFEDEAVVTAIHNAEALTVEDVKKFLEPYAKRVFKDKENEFYQAVVNRAHRIQKDLALIFKDKYVPTKGPSKHKDYKPALTPPTSSLPKDVTEKSQPSRAVPKPLTPAPLSQETQFWRLLDQVIQSTGGDRTRLVHILGALSASQRRSLRQSYQEDLDLVLGYPDRVDENIQRITIDIIDEFEAIENERANIGRSDKDSWGDHDSDSPGGWGKNHPLGHSSPNILGY